MATRRARGLSHLLAPTVSDSGGIHAAFQRLANSVHEFSGGRCELRLAPPFPQWESWQILQIYLIAQEAVLNAVRHLQTDRVVVALEPVRTYWRLVVFAQGRRRPSATSARGIGLQAMRYRARLLGARLRIYFDGTGRSLVRCVFPAEMDREPRE